MNESLIYHYKKHKQNQKEIIHFLNHLKKNYNSKVCIRHNNLDENEIISDSSENIIILLFDSVFWIIISDGSYNRQSKELLEIAQLLPDCLIPINLTNKRMVKYFFEHEFSDNLLEMYIDGDDEYEYFNRLSIYGEGLNYSIEFNQVLNLPGIDFEHIKLQPKNSDSILTFRHKNHLDVEGSSTLNETLDLARSFNRLFQNYLSEVEVFHNEENFNNRP